MGYNILAIFDNNIAITDKTLYGVRIIVPFKNNREIPVVMCVLDEEKRKEAEKQLEILGFSEIVKVDWELLNERYLSVLSDEEYIKGVWYARYNKEINLITPRTFNEKIQWLKLNSDYKYLSKLADKHAVKKYVSKIIGSDKVIPTIGIWSSYDEIDFATLPEKFVLKCTHDSGSVEIIRSKTNIDYEALKAHFDRALLDDYYLKGREKCYRDIPHKIIAEPIIGGDDLKDYKVHCFSGRPLIIQVDMDRFTCHTRNLYTAEWEYIDLSILYPTNPSKIASI